MVQNEQGLYMGIQLNPVARWKISGYADFFRFPWLRYGVDAPSSGTEYMAQVEYSDRDRVSMYLRYRYRQKESNRTPDNLPEALILPDEQHRVRYQFLYRPLTTLSSRTAIDFSVFDETRKQKSRGWMVSQSIGWKSPQIPLQADLYLAYFNTDDYATRIYAYEKNLLYVFNSPSFYDKGTRLSTVLRYFLTKKLSISTKIGWTHYFVRETIGSGLETIDGSNKTDMDLMIHWKF
jgi:hypothetical protein